MRRGLFSQPRKKGQGELIRAESSLISNKLPTVVAHADWSVSPAKRWLVAARLDGPGRYRAAAPVPVGDPATLLERLGGESLFLGLDLPLGLPLAYARRAGIEAFADWLVGLGRGDWAEVFDVAERPDEIALTRPFYPRRPGGAKLRHLVEGLGLESPRDLRRLCDLATATRPAAAPIFWTIGAQQVGKAALSAWAALLLPGRRAGAMALWPFDGDLAALLDAGTPVVAETYPGEIYRHLGIAFRRPDGRRAGKGRQADRAAEGARLRAVARDLEVALAPPLRRAIVEGFGPEAGGDDGFDATVGLLGMINVLRGRRPPGTPADPALRRVEGWILGQAESE